MAELILEHYSCQPLEWPPRDYTQTTDGHWHHMGKPRGLWVSVKGDDDWPSWCQAEEFRPEALTVRTTVKLRDDANVLILRGERDLFAFTEKYGTKWEIGERYTPQVIDWVRVATDYEGIIIAPYVWSCRLPLFVDGKRARVSDWYYGWDCASGCIWNGRAIAAFEAAETEDAHEDA